MRRAFLLSGLLALLPARTRAADPSPVLGPALTTYAAELLARLIERTREQAIAAGVEPVPTTVYRGLLGYFPDAVLRKVRFSVGHSDQIVLPNLAFAYGDKAAMTVGDVILFRDPAKARGDLKLWAHELTHVLQYQRWGIDGFADRYVRDSGGVEKEAYDNADRFEVWQRGRPRP